MTVSTDRAHTGGDAFKHSLSSCSDRGRAGVDLCIDPSTCPKSLSVVTRVGQTYYSWWVYFPVLFLTQESSGYLNIANWHEQDRNTGGDFPIWNLLVQPNPNNSSQMVLRLNGADSGDHIDGTIPITAGTWHNIEVNFPNRIATLTGNFQIWIDGVLDINLSNRRGVENSILYNYWQLQLYGGTNGGQFVPNPPFLMYTDDIKISASRIAGQ